MEETEVVSLIYTAVFVTFCIILFILYMGMRNRRTILIKEHALKVLEHEKQKDVLRAVVKTEERERLRIARDLHDSLGPALSSVQHILSRQAYKRRDSYSEELSAVSGQLEKIVDQFRSICFDLYPYALQKYGLVATMKQFLNSAAAAAGLRVTVADEPEQDWITEPSVALQVMRVFQEVINNMMKHAACNRVDLTFLTEGEYRKLRLLHDGKVFSDADAIQNAAKGHGLSSINARLALVNGSILYGEANGNALIEIKIPAYHGKDKNSPGRRSRDDAPDTGQVAGA